MANAPGNSSDFRSVMASVDAHGRRTWLHVHMIMGVWRIRRILLAIALIGFYLALPYLSVGGHPALLLDVPKRMAMLVRSKPTHRRRDGKRHLLGRQNG